MILLQKFSSIRQNVSFNSKFAKKFVHYRERISFKFTATNYKTNLFVPNYNLVRKFNDDPHNSLPPQIY